MVEPTSIGGANNIAGNDSANPSQQREHSQASARKYAPSLNTSISLDQHTGCCLLEWKNDAGEVLLAQTISPVSENTVHAINSLYEEFSTSSGGWDALQDFLAQVRANPGLKSSLDAREALLKARPEEILDLIESEVYFVPPSKARDSMLGTYTGGSLLSKKTLPQEEGDWALMSVDVVGLGRADRRSGDHVLKALAPLAQKHFGEDMKLLARDGGDEFVFLVKAPEFGAKTALTAKMELFKNELAEVRDNAFELAGEQTTERAIEATLMRNAFRSDLQHWREKCARNQARVNMKGFLEHLLEEYPELQSSIDLSNWPYKLSAQDMRLQGALSELFSPTSAEAFYQHRARELRKQGGNPLLDVRASITCYSGELTPEIVQVMRAQNNFEIDRLKNDPHAPVVVSDFGRAYSDPTKEFKLRKSEADLAQAVAEGDAEFSHYSAQLRELVGQEGKDQDVFDIACKLARSTCQDAQNPLGTRYSLGEHLLAGHLMGIPPGEEKEIFGFQYDLEDSGRWNNVLGPERYDEIVRECCQIAAISVGHFGAVRAAHSDRVGGGTFWQFSEFEVSDEDLKRVSENLACEYNRSIWSTHSTQLDHLTTHARMEKFGLEALDAILAYGPVQLLTKIDRRFPRTSTSKVIQMTVKAGESRREMHSRFEEAR